MQTILLIIQILLAVTLSTLILLQTKGTGFGRTFGGGGSATSFTRRGLERVVFKATFVLSILFVLVSILSVAL